MEQNLKDREERLSQKNPMDDILMSVEDESDDSHRHMGHSLNHSFGQEDQMHQRNQEDETGVVNLKALG